MSWKRIESIEIFSAPYVSLNKNKVQLPNGVIINDYYTIGVQNSVSVIALTEEIDIILIKQYRFCYDKELIELPAGVFNMEETDPLTVAKRELLEETGFKSENWTYLGSTIENPSKITNYNYLFLAKNCVRIDKQKLDETEDIEVLIVSFDTAVEMVMRNDICGNSTAHGILKTARILKR